MRVKKTRHHVMLAEGDFDRMLTLCQGRAYGPSDIIAKLVRDWLIQQLPDITALEGLPDV